MMGTADRLWRALVDDPKMDRKDGIRRAQSACDVLGKPDIIVLEAGGDVIADWLEEQDIWTGATPQKRRELAERIFLAMIEKARP